MQNGIGQTRMCEDFNGMCCNACHEDADEGYSELLEVYDSDGGLFALVCCGKVDAANRRAEED